MSGPPEQFERNGLTVRRYRADDVEALHEAILASIEHLRPWMPWASLEPIELDQRRDFLANGDHQWENGEGYNFGVFEGERVVGGCGLHRRVGEGGIEIGYWTRAGETGRGIATTGAGCLVDAAFSLAGVDFIEIHHDVANVASSKVPERLGFTMIEEREDGVRAPAESGVERVWRLDRAFGRSEVVAGQEPSDRSGHLDR